MSSCKLWIVIGMMAIETISIITATSDPGYSKYYRPYAKSKKDYSDYSQYYRNVGDAYRSLPMRRGKSYLQAHSPYQGSYHNRAYYNGHLKYSNGVPHFGYHAKHGSYRKPINRPMPYPMPHPDPHPVPHPDPHPMPHPQPHPIPNPTPHPITHPHPHPTPHPITHPLPVPHPQPVPVPHPHPTPIPHPVPSPVPIPHPQPHPAPAPTPIPVPIPEGPNIEIIPEETRPFPPIETIGRPPVAPSVQPPTLFELQRSVPGFVDIQRVNIRPLGEPIILEQIPEPQFKLLQQPIQNFDEDPKLVEIERGPSRAFEPLFPLEEEVPSDNVRNIQTFLNVQVPNRQELPMQTPLTVPLLAKAVPAVPESNPQPLFKTVNPATAQATALLLQASQADFAGIPFSIPVQSTVNSPIIPVQQRDSVAVQPDFRRLPSVILPDPVPAVPLTQP